VAARKRKKAAKRKKLTKAEREAIDDAALKAGYLEHYAARDANRRLSRIRSSMGIKLSTLDRWMQDDTFVDAVDAIDRRRLKAAEGLATTLWPEIIERQAQVAIGELPDPPPQPDKDLPDYGYQVSLLRDGYRAQCAAVAKLSTRAAELVGKYLHVLRDAPGVSVFGAEGVEVFGKLAEAPTVDELADEIMRRDGILDRHRARKRKAEAKAKKAAKGKP